jgi:hypothetical protein
LYSYGDRLWWMKKNKCFVGDVIPLFSFGGEILIQPLLIVILVRLWINIRFIFIFCCFPSVLRHLGTYITEIHLKKSYSILNLYISLPCNIPYGPVVKGTFEYYLKMKPLHIVFREAYYLGKEALSIFVACLFMVFWIVGNTSPPPTPKIKIKRAYNLYEWYARWSSFVTEEIFLYSRVCLIYRKKETRCFPWLLVHLVIN